MTTTLIYEILKKNEKLLRRKVYVGGNLRGLTTLPLLKKVKDGDILVCELDSWQLQGFGEAKISPSISVFTTFMPDHMNYYKNSMKKYFNDKANIFKYQKKDDVLIIRPEVKKLIPKNINSKLILINKKEVENWKFNVPGEYHRENLACAVEAAKQFKIPIDNIKKTISKFKDLEGRMQLLSIYKGIKIYNDNNATTPAATIAGIEGLLDVQRQNPQTLDIWKKKIVLICGGSDKKLELKDLVKSINKNCKAVVTIPGVGTDRLINDYKFTIKNKNVKNLKAAIKESLDLASRGDTILFSPAFASFGVYNNEYERNDEFIKIIKGLK